MSTVGRVAKSNLGKTGGQTTEDMTGKLKLSVRERGPKEAKQDQSYYEKKKNCHDDSQSKKKGYVKKKNKT